MPHALPMRWLSTFVAVASLSILMGCGFARQSSSTLPNAPFSEKLASDSTAARVYVADEAKNAVLVYPAGVDNPKPIQKITNGIYHPRDVATDGAGNLFVFSYGSTPYVSEYAPGVSTPFYTLQLSKTLATTPSLLAVGPDGTIYVLGWNYSESSTEIFEYYKGAKQPSLTILAPCCPGGGLAQAAAVDTKNDFYTIFEGGDCCGVGPIEFPRRSKKYSFVNHGLGASGPITFDKAGDLVVAAYDRQKGPYVRVITPRVSRSFKRASRPLE